MIIWTTNTYSIRSLREKNWIQIQKSRTIKFENRKWMLSNVPFCCTGNRSNLLEIDQIAVKIIQIATCSSTYVDSILESKRKSTTNNYFWISTQKKNQLNTISHIVAWLEYVEKFESQRHFRWNASQWNDAINKSYSCD